MNFNIFKNYYYNNLGYRKPNDRCILYVKNGSCVDCYIEDMRRIGIESIRYLPNLNMLIGTCEDFARSKKILRHPNTEYAEADISIRLEEPFVGNLSKLGTYANSWGINAIEASRAWELSSGKAVRVAIIDTGISKTHPAIRDNYKGGVNILSNKAEPDDFNGHGTHVAGIIAGTASDLGVIGVAPEAHLYAVKAFDRNGSASLSDLLIAIDWCIQNKMQAINMSFGMEKSSESMVMAVRSIYEKGIIMVAASGNQGLMNQVDYPAKYNETIAVCSVSKNKTLSRFNNMGSGLDIAAPGDRILSAGLNQTVREMSGTSMAVPHVTGVVALLLAMNDQLNTDNVKEILVNSAIKYDNLNGIGVLSAYNAVKHYDQSKMYQLNNHPS